MATRINGKVELAGVVTKNGEFLPLEAVIDIFMPRTPKDKEPYTKVYGEKLLILIKNRKLKASELEVFLWFVGKNSGKDGWNNEWINVDYEELAKELGFTSRTIKSAIKNLLKLKLIVQWKKRIPSFRLNPEYCFKGGVIAKNQIKREIADSEFKKKVEEWQESHT